MNTVRKLWENSNITTLFPSLVTRVRFDEMMEGHTSFQLGGPADLFVEPANRLELCALIEFFVSNGVVVSILGGGSNVLISDKGIRGAVISLGALNHIERCEFQPSCPEGHVLVRSGAGALMKALTSWCKSESLSGMERFAGLPGSVGGAVFMNARCYDISISDIYFCAEVLHFCDGGCTLVEEPHISSEWSYKKSPFQMRSGSDSLVLAENTRIVLSATFALTGGNAQNIQDQMDFYVKDREEKGHFRFPSAGSMFKNNHAFGKPSGKIIDEVGLRGFRIGDAQIAPWHGNIVINAGHATARDVRTLVEEVRKQVFEKTGFDLESEVIIAGEW